MLIEQRLRSPYACIEDEDLQRWSIDMGIMNVVDQPIEERGFDIKTSRKLCGTQIETVKFLAERDRRIVSNRILVREILGFRGTGRSYERVLHGRFIRLNSKLEKGSKVHSFPGLGRGFGVSAFFVPAGSLPIIDFLRENMGKPITRRELAKVVLGADDDTSVNCMSTRLFRIKHRNLLKTKVSIEQVFGGKRSWFVFVERDKWPYDYFTSPFT